MTPWHARAASVLGIGVVLLLALIVIPTRTAVAATATVVLSFDTFPVEWNRPVTLTVNGQQETHTTPFTKQYPAGTKVTITTPEEPFDAGDGTCRKFAVWSVFDPYLPNREAHPNGFTYMVPARENVPSFTVSITAHYVESSSWPWPWPWC